MPHFLTRDPPAMITMALAEALDLVDFGILLLSPDLKVRFLNRRQREAWALCLPPGGGDHISFRDLLTQAVERKFYPIAPEDRQAFIDEREAEIRNLRRARRTLDLTDGRRFLVTCQLTPEGGRMLTYVEETAWREFEARQRRALAEMEQRDAEFRINAALLENHGAHLAALVEAAEAAALQAIEANSQLEQEVQDRNRLMLDLQRMATTDALTGLLNRARFMSLAADVVHAATLHGYGTAVMMLDIDHFKSINDDCGHAVGDMVLQLVSARLSGVIRPSDVLGRLGGEEFAVVMPAVSSETACAIAARLRAAVADDAVRTGDHLLWVTVSIGMTMLQPCDNSIDTALARADSALYKAKRGGRNCVRAWEPLLVETLGQ